MRSSSFCVKFSQIRFIASSTDVIVTCFWCFSSLIFISVSFVLTHAERDAREGYWNMTQYFSSIWKTMSFRKVFLFCVFVGVLKAVWWLLAGKVFCLKGIIIFLRRLAHGNIHAVSDFSSLWRLLVVYDHRIIIPRLVVFWTRVLSSLMLVFCYFLKRIECCLRVYPFIVWT